MVTNGRRAVALPSQVAAVCLGWTAAHWAFGCSRPDAIHGSRDIPVPAAADNQPSPEHAPIDRQALVRRHTLEWERVDPAAPAMVGNGSIALTADLTGLSTFPEQYSPRVPLMTQAQWAWHSFPNPKGFSIQDSLVPLEVHGIQRPFAWLKDWSEAQKPAIQWLRRNPHRFSLGRLALALRHADGTQARFEQLTDTHQQLDLWTGRLHSSFALDGERVQVETSVHPQRDAVIVTLRSTWVPQQRVGVTLHFPAVALDPNPDPADWERPQAHTTTLRPIDEHRFELLRTIDATRYSARVRADHPIFVQRQGPHQWTVQRAKSTDGPIEDSRDQQLTVIVSFSPTPTQPPLPPPAVARAAVASHWAQYWSQGAAVDLHRATDPRAPELERRIVLSQYLMAVNAAGDLPPQEEGLFSNSWNGKFHLEMHLWHAAHFATWGRPALLERSLSWYQRHLPQAKQRALAHGLGGAYWPKMVGPEGRESPSTINPLILWQQPSPIFLCELVYRATPTLQTLQRYEQLVLQTAELLASMVLAAAPTAPSVLGPPVVPAQEVYPPLQTYDPTFEISFFRYGLNTAQQWRRRLQLPADLRLAAALRRLPALPTRDQLYLGAASHPELWTNASSPECSRRADSPHCINRDHPSFLGSLGLLPGSDVHPATMRNTLAAVRQHWDRRKIWGWDLPLMAMTAARLGDPEQAVDWLLHDAPNFRFGATGMTPRVHHDATRIGATDQDCLAGPQYHCAAETYFPSNGALLLAVGMMAGGWEGQTRAHPGFPTSGWEVQSEGLVPLP